MSDEVKTWHYGVMARHWAENNTTGPEIVYFHKLIERYGQPALDAGCGTGRLPIPFLRAGLDVDGCDVSADMLAYCRQKAKSLGLAPALTAQCPPETWQDAFSSCNGVELKCLAAAYVSISVQ